MALNRDVALFVASLCNEEKAEVLCLFSKDIHRELAGATMAPGDPRIQALYVAIYKLQDLVLFYSPMELNDAEKECIRHGAALYGNRGKIGAIIALRRRYGRDRLSLGGAQNMVEKWINDNAVGNKTKDM